VSETQHPSDRPLAGAAFVIAGVGIASTQDVVLKLMSDGYPIFQVAVTRSLVSISIICAILIATRQVGQFRPNRPVLIALRGLLTFASYTCFYLALASVPLADAVSIFFVTPLLVTALSVPLLSERVGMRRWSAVIVGFLGVLVMVRPGFETMEPALLIALGGPVGYAFAIILTRRIGMADSGSTLVLYNMVTFGLASAAGAALLWVLDLPVSENPSLAFLLRDWGLPSTADLCLMALTGAVITVAHFCTAQAYRIAPPSFVSGFEYSYFIWAVLLGFFIWGELPDRYTFIGAAIVMASGAYVLHRETVVKRAARQASNQSATSS